MRRIIVTFGVVASVVALLVVLKQIEPNRIGSERAAAAERAQEQLRKAEETEARLIAEAEQDDAAAGTQNGEGETFMVKFETTKGDFVAKFYEDWAPLGYERMQAMVNQNVLDGAYFFRVVPQFVVQFGIPGDPEVAKKWRTDTIKDDPVKKSNVKGTITFATAGPNSRTTQLFINLNDRNSQLDGMGFAPVGEIVEGMDVVESLESKYGDQPTSFQGEIASQGKTFLDKNFPGLDYIKSVSFVEAETEA